MASNIILQHKTLINLLQRTYSAEKAASFAYQWYRGTLKNAYEKKAIYKIEMENWHQSATVFSIMLQYNVPVSKYYEIKYAIIGTIISVACYFIGWFMPYFFAGKLESGNICEYFRMMQYFDELGITKQHQELYDMGIKEKEHKIYFLNKIKTKRKLGLLEQIMAWSNNKKQNDANLDKKYPMAHGLLYCKKQLPTEIIHEYI